VAAAGGQEAPAASGAAARTLTRRNPAPPAARVTRPAAHRSSGSGSSRTARQTTGLPGEAVQPGLVPLPDHLGYRHVNSCCRRASSSSQDQDSIRGRAVFPLSAAGHESRNFGRQITLSSWWCAGIRARGGQARRLAIATGSPAAAAPQVLADLAAARPPPGRCGLARRSCCQVVGSYRAAPAR
jgi:hypothetical protein